MNFELEQSETLRIKKIGKFHYAYARSTEGTFFGSAQKERYLGRCDEDGTPYNRSIGSYRINRG